MSYRNHVLLDRCHPLGNADILFKNAVGLTAALITVVMCHRYLSAMSDIPGLLWASRLLLRWVHPYMMGQAGAFYVTPAVGKLSPA